MNRRSFLKAMGAAAAAVTSTKVYSFVGSGLWTPPSHLLGTDRVGDMETRMYGYMRGDVTHITGLQRITDTRRDPLSHYDADMESEFYSGPCPSGFPEFVAPHISDAHRASIEAAMKDLEERLPYGTTRRRLGL